MYNITDVSKAIEFLKDPNQDNISRSVVAYAVASNNNYTEDSLAGVVHVFGYNEMFKKGLAIMFDNGTITNEDLQEIAQAYTDYADFNVVGGIKC